MSDEQHGPGWYWEPSQNAYFYWDGRQYTMRAQHVSGNWAYAPLTPVRTPVEGVGRSRRDPRRTRQVFGVIIAEMAVLMWGGWMISHADEKQCSETSQLTYVDIGDLPWLPWLALAVLVWIGFELREERWTKVMSNLSLAVLVLTFPGFVACAGLANCGL